MINLGEPQMFCLCYGYSILRVMSYLLCTFNVANMTNLDGSVGFQFTSNIRNMLRDPALSSSTPMYERQAFLKLNLDEVGSNLRLFVAFDVKIQ